MAASDAKEALVEVREREREAKEVANRLAKWCIHRYGLHPLLITSVFALTGRLDAIPRLGIDVVFRADAIMCSLMLLRTVHKMFIRRVPLGKDDNAWNLMIGKGAVASIGAVFCKGYLGSPFLTFAVIVAAAAHDINAANDAVCKWGKYKDALEELEGRSI